MFISSQPDGRKNLICYKKLIAAENLKDLLEGLSCNKSRQDTKEIHPALPNCCLSISFPTAAPRLYLTSCPTMGTAPAGSRWPDYRCYRSLPVQTHASLGAYSSHTCQPGSFEGNLLCALRNVSALHTKARGVETARGFASKACSHPTHGTAVDTATRTELSRAYKCLTSRFTISMVCLLTPVRAHPSPGCHYPLQSKSVSWLHLLAR